MYAMLCTRLDICYAVGVVSRYQSDIGEQHWIVVKDILEYLRGMRYYMLVYSSGSLETVGYTDSDFQEDIDFRNLHSDMFLLLIVETFVEHSSFQDSIKGKPSRPFYKEFARTCVREVC